MIISLTPDIERTLIEQARMLGTTPEQLAADSLRERFSQGLPCGARSEAERTAALTRLLRDHAGVLDSRGLVPGGANMSEETGGRFTEILSKKHRRRAQ